MIIGCNAAGVTAASYSRGTDRVAEITIVERVSSVVLRCKIGGFQIR